jgi:hypothetical protein
MSTRNAPPGTVAQGGGGYGGAGRSCGLVLADPNVTSCGYGRAKLKFESALMVMPPTLPTWLAVPSADSHSYMPS